MEEIDLLEQIKHRLEALQTRVEARADPKLLAEVAATIRLADVHLPSVFMQARRVLEIIVRDIYRRELPDAKPKPLNNTIEALYQQKGLIDARIAGDLHYIRANGNLITHAQAEPVEPDPSHAEKVLFIFLGVVEWYLEDYLPARTGSAPATATAASGPPPPSPSRGLAAFRPQDAANYFGRERDIADLAATVARQPLLAVAGPSGSGKSSIVTTLQRRDAGRTAPAARNHRRRWGGMVPAPTRGAGAPGDTSRRWSVVTIRGTFGIDVRTAAETADPVHHRRRR